MFWHGIVGTGRPEDPDNRCLGSMEKVPNDQRISDNRGLCRQRMSDKDRMTDVLALDRICRTSGAHRTTDVLVLYRSVRTSIEYQSSDRDEDQKLTLK